MAVILTIVQKTFDLSSKTTTSNTFEIGLVFEPTVDIHTIWVRVDRRQEAQTTIVDVDPPIENEIKTTLSKGVPKHVPSSLLPEVIEGASRNMRSEVGQLTPSTDKYTMFSVSVLKAGQGVDTTSTETTGPNTFKTSPTSFALPLASSRNASANLTIILSANRSQPSFSFYAKKVPMDMNAWIALALRITIDGNPARTAVGKDLNVETKPTRVTCHVDGCKQPRTEETAIVFR